MRYSKSERFGINEVKAPSPRGRTGHARLLRRVVRETTEQDRLCAVVLAGGTTHADLAVRQVQAPLRFDRRPSKWSHAALILEWPDDARPQDIVGAEVALDPDRSHAQVPERNGVTLFTLDRFCDAKRFAHLAIATLRMNESRGVTKAAKRRMQRAALEPCGQAHRFRCFEWMGEWHRHVFAGGASPLESHAAHPGAAYLDYVYEAGGFDLTPGATEPVACPEIIWSTLLYWYGCLDRESDSLDAWCSISESEHQRDAKQKSLRTDLRRLARSTRAT